ncbi:MAG: hypothetical protein RJQ14_13235 [Marinoscillum sp.]
MNSEITWVLLILTNLFGGLAVLMLIYILKIKKSHKRSITTYSHRKSKAENGPVLKLPDGVVSSSYHERTRA